MGSQMRALNAFSRIDISNTDLLLIQLNDSIKQIEDCINEVDNTKKALESMGQIVNIAQVGTLEGLVRGKLQRVSTNNETVNTVLDQSYDEADKVFGTVKWGEK